jgi:hypothetical protein
MAQGIVLQLQNTTSFEEVNVQYVVIWCQWYFFGVAPKNAIHELSNWLGF